MDSLKQSPTTKVRLSCPAGHAMFPKGIFIKTLYSDHGIRLLDTQKTEAGYDWEAAEAKMRKMIGDDKARIKRIQNHPEMFPCFQLTQLQMEYITCGECAKAK